MYGQPKVSETVPRVLSQPDKQPYQIVALDKKKTSPMNSNAVKSLLSLDGGGPVDPAETHRRGQTDRRPDRRHGVSPNSDGQRTTVPTAKNRQPQLQVAPALQQHPVGRQALPAPPQRDNGSLSEVDSYFDDLAREEERYSNKDKKWVPLQPELDYAVSPPSSPPKLPRSVVPSQKRHFSNDRQLQTAIGSPPPTFAPTFEINPYIQPSDEEMRRQIRDRQMQSALRFGNFAPDPTVEHTMPLEQKLIQLCSQKQRMHEDLLRMGSASGKTLAERKKKTDLETGVVQLGQDISALRTQIKKLQQL